MNYNDEEIERAKAIFAREKRNGVPGHMAVAAMAGLSRPAKIARVSHKRTWRDCLSQARHELRDER
tara:strand:- start:138326 stop:138523 length:198 start_codon:yes stop_codon:yes gene_type:complete